MVCSVCLANPQHFLAATTKPLLLEKNKFLALYNNEFLGKFILNKYMYERVYVCVYIFILIFRFIDTIYLVTKYKHLQYLSRFDRKTSSYTKNYSKSNKYKSYIEIYNMDLKH